MEVSEIWKRYKCDPTDVDMRNRLIDQYFPLVRKHAGQIDQLIEDKNSENKGRSLRDSFVDREGPPDRPMASRDQLQVIVQSLSRTERLIVLFYYYEHMNMREIGKALDISESRVSQLHSRIVARLEESLANRRDEFFKE